MAHEYKGVRNSDIYGLVNQLNEMAANGWEAVSVLQAAPEQAEGRPMFVAVVKKAIPEN